MQYETFMDYLTDHMADRQRPHGVPEPLLDQVDAAALEGASTIDAVAKAGRESGALVQRSVGSSDVLMRLTGRFTESVTCTHLAERPVQPRYMVGAVPERAFCLECVAAFLDDESFKIQHHEDRRSCDICECETELEDLHFGNMSTGVATYIVQLCGPCLSGDA
jgi:hypothetical protein